MDGPPLDFSGTFPYTKALPFLFVPVEPVDVVAVTAEVAAEVAEVVTVAAVA